MRMTLHPVSMLLAFALSFGDGALDLRALCDESAAAVHSGTIEAYSTKLSAALSSQCSGKSASAIQKFALKKNGSLALMQHQLLTNLQSEGRASLGRNATLQWLLSDPSALEMILSSGPAAAGKWTAAVGVLDAIVSQHEEAKRGLSLRLAVALALVFAEPVKSMADGSAIDPLKRYESFLRWDSEGVLFPSFRDLSAWELRYVVGSWSKDEELEWARANIKPELKQRDKVGDGAHMLAYNSANKSGVSVQEGAKFYDNKPMTLAIMLEYGGVCGAISRFGTSMSQAFGVPAMPIGQPGHCAFIWQKDPHKWSINNDISGWPESGCHGGIYIPFGQRSWCVPVMQQAQEGFDGFAASERLRAAALIVKSAASSTETSRVQAAILARACVSSPHNMTAWQERIALMQGANRSEWVALQKQLAVAFASHPNAYGELLASIEPSILGTDPSTAERIEWIESSVRQLSAMVANGGDSYSAGCAVTEIVARAGRAMCPNAADAANAMARGEDGRKLAIDFVIGERMSALCIAACDAADAGPSGTAHDMWTQLMGRLIRGVILQPTVREVCVRRLEAACSSLMNQHRENDARWIADRIIEASKAAEDPALEGKAVQLRTSLG